MTTSLARVVESATAPEPLNAIADAVTLPVREKFLLVCKIVADEALPINAPVKFSDAKLLDEGL